MMDKLSDLEILALSVSIFEGSTGLVSSVGINCLLIRWGVRDDGGPGAEAEA
jgi:hypothetical protein